MKRLNLAIGLVCIYGMLAVAAPSSAAGPAGPSATTTVLGWAPGVTSGLPPSFPLSVYFNRPVNPVSARAAWHLTPSIQGTFRYGTASITFIPRHPLSPDTGYTLSVRGARSTSGAPLVPFSTHFTTGSALQITRLAPAPTTQEVPLTGVISVSFNHPMVPLAGVDAETAMPRGWALSIHPALAGYGSWLNTSTWVFRPASTLAPATAYTVTLKRTVQDSWGQQLGKNAQWTFRTATPEIYAHSPRNYSQDVSPHTDVRVTFSQPMDHASTARAFRVTSAGAEVPGSISWSGATLIFRSSAPLTGDRLIQVTVSNSARSANRQATLQRPTSWSFHVAPYPKFESTDPARNHTAWAQPPEPYYYGSCCGRGPYSVSILFSAPMNKTSLDKHLHIAPAVGSFDTSLGENSTGDWVYTVSGDFKPSSSYTVTINSGVVDAFGRPLPGSITYPFKTSEMYPSVALYGMPNSSMIAFSSGQIVRAPLQTINVPMVRFDLVKTTLFGLQSLTQNCGGCPPAGATVRKWSEQTNGITNQIENPGVRLKTKAGTPLQPGLYWLSAESPESVPGWVGGPENQNWPPFSTAVFVVNNVSITAKSASNGTLVWVDDTKTGKPLSGATVRLVNPFGATVVAGKTDARGLHFFRGYTQYGSHNVFAAAMRDATHFGLAALFWQPNTTSPSFFTWPWQNSGPSSNGTYAYTDRPVYRPGQTVHFRAVLWHDSDAVYALPADKQVNARVIDSRGKNIFTRRFTLDRFGAISGTLRIPANAPTGDFNVYVGIPNGPSVGTSFTVANYRKPEFLTSVKAASPRFVQGQTAAVNVSVHYVFGAPVSHQRLQWTAYSNPVVQSPPGWDAYTFVNWEQLWTQWWQIDSLASPQYGALGQTMASGVGRTDANGKLVVHLPVAFKKDPLDRSVAIEVTATDANAQSVSGRTTIQEFHSDLAIGLQAKRETVEAGSPAAIHIVTVHQSGAAAPGTRVTAVIKKRTYTSKLVSVNGTPQWQPVPKDTRVATQPLTTDASGKATLTFTPATGGEYYVVFSGTDATGNSTKSSLSIFASSNGVTDWSQSENTSITIKPDHQTYTVGQTSHILVPSPFANPTVLVSVERGTIRRYWTTSFKGTSGTVSVPLGIDALPDEYVSVTLYHGWRGSSPPEWRTGTAELHLRLDPRRVKVQLAQPGGRHHPGDRISYTVKTTTPAGKPLSTEVSLALVDTAVLALKDQTNADIVQALYAERPLGVTTASEGAISIDNLTNRADFSLASSNQGKVLNGVPAAAPMTGGGGGGGYNRAPVFLSPHGADRSASAAVPGVTLRSHFADTAFWRGAVTTNASGLATVSLTLPDNTTTWRLDARGISATQAVGGSTLKTLATRDLVLRPVLPRFFIQGDHLRVGVVLNNRLDRAASATVTLAASGLRLSARPQTVIVPRKGEHLLLFPAAVPVSHAAVLTARAVSHTPGVQGDAVQQAVPVHPPLTDETTATTGQVYDSTRQMVIVPRNAVSVPGALTVSLQSSITAGLGDAYGQPKPSQYESNDDVASRVLAAASLHTLPQPITGLSRRGYAHLPLDTALGVQKLLDSQWYDGGWPWFNGELNPQSDPLVTADAIQALTASGRHSPQIANALQRGRQYLANQLGHEPAPLRAHLLAVLITSGAGSTGHFNAEDLYADSIRRLHLDAGALADLGTSLALSGDASKGKTVVASLEASARVSATGAHWESSNDGFWAGPPIGNTAEVLATLLRLSPNNPLEPAASRWLMLARRGAGWDCNRDTAQAIAALARYARSTREGTADYQYRVAVPASSGLHGSFTPQSVRFSAHMSVPIASLRRARTVGVDISRSAAGGSYGAGPLYYLARLHYYLPANDIPARNQGVSVSRQFLTLAGTPVNAVKLGSAVKVQLTVRTSQTLVYLDLRDPLCSGCEPIDESLNTSQQGIAPRPAWSPWQSQTSVQDLSWYLIHSDLRDDHVSLYAYSLPPGVYQYTYLVQATVAGTYAVPPTHAAEHFFPEVFGRSHGQVLRVT